LTFFFPDIFLSRSTTGAGERTSCDVFNCSDRDIVTALREIVRLSDQSIHLIRRPGQPHTAVETNNL
jgi:hypothetical protein